MPHTTAILIFARSVRAEQLHKKLDRPGEQAIYRFLYQQTINCVKASGIPFYQIDESQQKGTTFGERFNNAIRQVFDLGYSNIIAVGADCPQRTTQDLLHSRQLVERGVFCLGPDTHGGVHLIGISKNFFETGILDTITWNTALVLPQLISWLNKAGVAYQPISTYTDINHYGDLHNLLKSTSIHHSLWQILKQLLFRFIKKLPIRKPSFIGSSLSLQLLFRGPPALFFSNGRKTATNYY